MRAEAVLRSLCFGSAKVTFQRDNPLAAILLVVVSGPIRSSLLFTSKVHLDQGPLTRTRYVAVFHLTPTYKCVTTAKSAPRARLCWVVFEWGSRH